VNFSAHSWKAFFLPEKGRFWLILMLTHMALTAVIGVALPGLTQDFYQGFTGDVLTPFLVLGGLFLAEYANRLGYQITTYKYVQHLLGETRARTFGLWMRAPLKVKKGTLDDYPMGEVLARVMSDSDAVKELVTSGAFAIIIDFIFIISSLIGFIRLDAGLGAGLFALEVVACVLLIWGSRKMGVVFASVRVVTGLVSRVVTDVTHGLRELAFTPHRQYASTRGQKVFEDFLAKQLRANVWDAGYYAAAESLYPILLALVLVFLPTGETARMALLAVLIDLIQKSITPIKEVAGKISGIQRARTGLHRIREFQAHFAMEAMPVQQTVASMERFQINLSHYEYPPREGETPFDLRAVSFSGKAGELVGIVGPSGCGKSTLLRLLSGQHGPFQGQVTVNDRVLDTESNVDLAHLGQQVSLVSQDSHVFSASVSFNVGLGTLEGLTEFWQNALQELPYLGRWGVDLDTVVNPKKLSLGQKQLLSGLRACFLRKPVVLFDEVSSGLDPELEKALRDLVLFVQRRSLTIIVTHRIETILGADRLVVMDQGRAIDQGRPAELEQRSPLFVEFLRHLRS
jgi:ATP-binding cassette subfamily B multidrug efflux pump